MESVESNEGGETLALGGAKCFIFPHFPFIFRSEWPPLTEPIYTAEKLAQFMWWMRKGRLTDTDTDIYICGI